MNLNTNSFFNSTDINISSRMNEYLKKNFGYEVEGDFDTLKEAKQSLEAEQVELKSDYMSAKYIENMLMIETITSLLKAHGETLKETPKGHHKMPDGKLMKDKDHPKESAESVNEEKISVDGQGSVETDYYTVIVSSGDMGIVVDIKDKNDNEIDSRQYWDEDAIGEGKEPVTEDDNEEKGPDHYRWKNDSQLSIAKDKLIACMAQLDHAIDYRAENSHLFFNTGDKAGTGDLYRMKEQLEKLHDGWEEATELYGM